MKLFILILFAIGLVAPPALAAPVLQGTISSSGASTNNLTTGTAFAPPLGPTSLQCDGDVYLYLGADNTAAATSGNGLKVFADQEKTFTLTTYRKVVAILPVSGTASCKLYALYGETIFYAGSRSSTSTTAILSTLAGEGSLTRADKDVYGNTFVIGALSPDGEVARYAIISTQDARWKLGPGSSMEMIPSGNSLTFNVGELHVPTTFIEQPACAPGQTCRWYSDPGHGFGVFPSGDTSGCFTDTEGIFKGNSTTHRLNYCDGTALRPLSEEVDGALQLPAYATADLPAAAPSGGTSVRVVFDTDSNCVKWSNGTTWSCLP